MKRIGIVALLLAFFGGGQLMRWLLTLFPLGNPIQNTLDVLHSSVVLSAGTANITTITINGSPDAGTFAITYQGVRTPAQQYNVSLANLQAALVALPGIGAGGVVVTGTPGSSYVLTWQHVGARGAITIAAADMLMTKTGTLVAVPGIVNGTPGVDPVPKGVAVGGLVNDLTVQKLYRNTGTVLDPTWTEVSTA